MNDLKPLVVLAAGGTGGHMFPAQALATELAGRGCRLALVTDRRGDAWQGGRAAVETYRIRAGGLAGKHAPLFLLVPVAFGGMLAFVRSIPGYTLV